MQFVIITPFDPLPEDGVRPGRYWNFAKQIADAGHELVWITSRYSHLNKKFRSTDSVRSESELKNVRIIKIDTVGYARNVSVRRLVNHAQFGISVLYELRRLIRDRMPDAIICANPPLLAPFFAARLGRRYGIPVVVDIIDLWPEAFGRIIKNNAVRRMLFAPLQALSRATVRLSAALTGVSNDYTDHFRRCTDGKAVRTFHLGHCASGFATEIRPDWSHLTKRDGERWVTYVGTVSKNYDLETVIHAARRLPEVRFLIVGKGEGRSDLERKVREERLGNVVMTGEVPYRDLANILHRSDVGLVTVNNDAFIRFPYKANDYLVAGLPIMTNIRGGEMENLLSENRIGEVYQEGDVSDFVSKLMRLLASADDGMKERVKRYAAENCDSDRVYHDYLAWITEIVAERRIHP